MKPVLAFLPLWLVACGRPAPAPQPKVDARAEAPKPDPRAKPTREELVKQAVSRVPKVRAEVSALRGLPASDVPAQYQTQEEFQRYLEAELAVEFPGDKAASLARSMFLLGLLKEQIDLKAVLLDAFKTQAGAYYDPLSKKFFIVLVPEDPTMLDVLSAHELTHAVQDQNFDLVPFLGGRGNAKGLPEDAINARRFVMEGEATLVMMAYMTKVMTKQNPFEPGKLESLRMQVSMLAGMSMEDISRMTKSSMSGMINLGEDFKKAVEAMDKIPPYVLVPLYDAYFKGSLTVLEVFAAGGWEAVKELYANPPDSTEQTLHPVEKLVRKRDLPRRFEPPTLKALASWKRLHSDVLGELSWRVYFWNWGRKDAPELAAGWDGDRWTVWADGDKTAGVVQTVWDSPAEAAQFADAYQATVATRGVKALVKPDGDRVTIVLGCDVIDCAAVMKDVEKAKPK